MASAQVAELVDRIDDSNQTLKPVERVGDEVRVAGKLRMRDVGEIWSALRSATESPSKRCVIELSRLESADSGIIALLLESLENLKARGISAELVGANPSVDALVALYASHERDQAAPTRPESAIARLGRATYCIIAEARGLFAFVAEFARVVGSLTRRPRAANWRAVPALCEKAGADAVPIVLLINFLVGFVMAFQSAKQLKLYGANIYVADLVAIALCRELAPLMTAIIVCGRSGAAFAAELGSMKVNEEVDALRTLGLVPYGWLVVPRTLALMFVVPLLTLLAGAVGILGGMVVASTDLGVSPQGYLNETLTALTGWDIATGVLKSAIFSVVIALVACQQGLAASGGAEAVGKRTTSCVVTILFSLVLIDALLTATFRLLDV